MATMVPGGSKGRFVGVLGLPPQKEILIIYHLKDSSLKFRLSLILSLMIYSWYIPFADAQDLQRPLSNGPEYPSLRIAGFGDFNFSATDKEGSKNGFNEGQFVLHFSSALSPTVSFFGEISLTSRPDAGTGAPAPTAPGFNAELERAIIRFDQSDRLKVSFGRYHTPIHWWNTAFHHGQWLQTTISRPEMVKFGGSLIPVHFVGGLIEGAFPAQGLNLNYNVSVGNGRASVISRAGDAGDANNNRAKLVHLFTKPDRLYGLQVGASLYNDLITLSQGPDFREWITGGYMVWQKENPEMIAEIADIRHGGVNDVGGFDSLAYYVQVAYRLPFWEELWKPYYRYEYIDVAQNDPVFQETRKGLDQTSSIGGIRYDISQFAAVKAEYRRQQRPDQKHVNGAFAQVSFTF